MTATQKEWWRGGVIYQIYPRSFADDNGDGVGDLNGITRSLTHVADLGVDAIWVSPFFRSPMRDFGYDVSDYRDVDPLFGTLEDFDRLVARAHELGLKVMIDQVLSHTSDLHPWFIESRASRDHRENSRADWYVWADPRPDGTPPNNWLSVFGGSAWAWDSRRQQYYLHNFLASQPDLNYHNPAVIEQVLEDVEFWLERGVDGFRLDTVNYFFHDQALRDNPPIGDGADGVHDVPETNPYRMQRHVYDKTRPENVAFLQRLRALLDRYPGRTMVGEIGAEDGLGVMAEYTAGGDKLHMAYTFDLLGKRSGAAYVRQVVEALEARVDDGWPCWSLSNHDVMRFATRWGGENPAPAFVKVLLAMLLSLRGSVCLYQGDELGLPEANVPFERLQDPYGIAFWPGYKGRDGARTPMLWKAGALYAGFSTVEPWLPQDAAHHAFAVDVQAAAPDSVLNACRRFLAWRKQHPALRIGGIRFIDAAADVLAFWRESDDERLLVALNLGEGAAELLSPDVARVEPLDGHGFESQRDGERLILPAYGAFFGRL